MCYLSIKKNKKFNIYIKNQQYSIVCIVPAVFYNQSWTEFVI